MTTAPPDALESPIRSAVRVGRFATLDEAMAEAARPPPREIERGQPKAEDIPGPAGQGPATRRS
jgi:hypothetical protein